MGFLELQSCAAGILDHPRCLHNINVFCSVRKSHQEQVSMNLQCICGGCCVDEFAAVEAAVEVSPQ